MANITADYDAVVSLIAVTGDVSLSGVVAAFGLQIAIAIACIAGFSILRPLGTNKFIYQPRLEFADEVEDKNNSDLDANLDPLDDSFLAWTKPVFKEHHDYVKIRRIGLDATMLLALNKFMFVTFTILSLLGIPYAIFNQFFPYLSGMNANTGIVPEIYNAVKDTGFIVVAAFNNTIVGVGQTPPLLPVTTKTTRTSSTIPSPTTTLLSQIRCGNTWMSANQTCGNLCVNDGDCFNGQLCYKDLVSCSNSSSPLVSTTSSQIRCGTDWFSANQTCGNLCNSDDDCYDGLLCYKNLVSCANFTVTSFTSQNTNETNDISETNSSLIIATSLSALTINQIDPKSAWFWLPAFLTWIFSFVLYAMLLLLSKLYVKHRRFYFSTNEFKDSLAHRSLFLTYIPNIKTNQALSDFVNSCDHSLNVVEATINRNSFRLGQLVQIHKDKTEELERYLTNLFEKEDRHQQVQINHDLPSEAVEIHHHSPHVEDIQFGSNEYLGVENMNGEEGEISEQPFEPKQYELKPGSKYTPVSQSQENTNLQHQQNFEIRYEYKPETKLQALVSTIKKQWRNRPLTNAERTQEIRRLEHEINKLEEEIESIRQLPEHETPSNESGFISFSTPQEAHKLIKTIRSHHKYVKKFGGIHIKFSPEFSDIFWANIGRHPHEIFARRFFALAITISVVVGYILLLGILSTLQTLSVIFQSDPPVLNWLQQNPILQNFVQAFVCPIPVSIVNWVLPLILQFITFLQGVKSGAGRDRSIIYKNYVLNMIQIFIFSFVAAMIQNSLNDSQVPDFVFTDPVVKRIVTGIESLAEYVYEVEQETYGSYFPKIFNVLSFSVGFFQVVTLLVIYAGNATAIYSIQDSQPPKIKQWMILVPLPFITALLWLIVRIFLIPRGIYCTDDYLAFDAIPPTPHPYSLTLAEHAFNGAAFVKPLARVTVAPIYKTRLPEYYTPRRRVVDYTDPRVRAYALGLPSLEWRRGDVARTLVRSGRLQTFRWMSVAEIRTMGIVPEEEVEEMEMQETVLEMERRRVERIVGGDGGGEEGNERQDKTGLQEWSCSKSVLEKNEKLPRETEIEVEIESVVESELSPESKLTPIPHVEFESDAVPAVKLDAIIGLEFKVGSAPESELEPEVKPESEVEVVLKLEPEIEPQVEPSLPGPELELVSESVTEPEPEIELVLKFEPEIAPQVEPVPEPDAEPTFNVPEPEVEHILEPDPEIIPQVEPALEPEPEPKVEKKNSQSESEILTSLEVDVINPREVVDEINKANYVEYEITFETTIPGFTPTGSVYRKYRDFVALRNDLISEFPEREFPPPLPKVKIVFRKSPELVESRRKVFADFLKSIAADDFLHKLKNSGNFSFSLALSRALFESPITFAGSDHANARAYLNIPKTVNAKNIKILATSFDSRDQLLRKYLEFKDIERNLARFSGNVKLLHEINAWELTKTFTPKDDGSSDDSDDDSRWMKGQRSDGTVGFDTVAWNHPHLGTEDFRLHRFLMAHFFSSVFSVLRQTQSPTTSVTNTSADNSNLDTFKCSVVVSLVSGQEIRWDLMGQAARSNLVLATENSPFPFNEQDWKGYVVKRNMHGKSFKNEATKKRMADDMKSFGFRFVYGQNIDASVLASKFAALGLATNNDVSNLEEDGNVAANGGFQIAKFKAQQLQPQVVGEDKNPAYLYENQLPSTKQELNDLPLPVPLACGYCLKLFSTPRAYKQHVLQIHILKQRGENWTPDAPRVFKCRGWPDSNVEACGKQFNSEDGRYQHEVIKHSQFNEGETLPSFESKTAAQLEAESVQIGEGKALTEAAITSIEPFLNITDEPTQDADYYPCEVCAQAVARRPWGMALHLETLKPIVGLDMRCPNLGNHLDGDKLFIERQTAKMWTMVGAFLAQQIGFTGTDLTEKPGKDGESGVHITCLPVEILEQIVLYLAIDGHTVRSVALSTRVFALSLLGFAFAKRHVEAQLSQSSASRQAQLQAQTNSNNNHSVLRPFALHLTNWDLLPLVYKTHVLLAMCTRRIPWTPTTRLSHSQAHDLVILLAESLVGFDISQQQKQKQKQKPAPPKTQATAKRHFRPGPDGEDGNGGADGNGGDGVQEKQVLRDALLCWACKRNHSDAAMTLIHYGADPACGGNDPITLTATEGYEQLCRKLLAFPDVDPSVDHDYALRVVCACGHKDVCDLLLADPRTNPARDSNNAIRSAAILGYHEIVETLLKDPRVDPTENNNNALWSSAEAGKTAVVQLLLNDGRCDPSALNNHAIRMAAKNGHTAIVELLLNDSRTDPSADDYYALRIASQNNFSPIVKLFLSDYRIPESVKKEFSPSLLSNLIQTFFSA
ncbi:hypothetical protein HK100_012314 [Physocladia obscura]|uniref:PX domain-containing protein n=1 Tax=Physocladia obscura TaxID=109957 RepID=A0AAD5XK17_9FUNG|nr:hypothetical protein HK100_012314 [Physocladia obscura]